MALNATIDLTVKKPDFKSMKSEIKELTIAAQQAVMQFGEFSPEARKAEAALASARDRMEDFNDRVKAVNPDKFAKLNTVVMGVANGFQAAQGAMALFGNESKDFEKTMIKLQGAMALTQGLEGLGKVQQQFTAIAKSIGGAFTGMGQMIAAGFKAGATSAQMFKSVLSTLGIGAIIIAVGYLVDKFLAMKDAGGEAAKALSEVSKEQRRLAGEIQKLGETELETNTRLLAEVKAARAKHNKDMNLLFDDLNRATEQKDKDALNIKIKQETVKDTALELQERQYQKNIDKITTDAANAAKAKQDKLDADAAAERERKRQERIQKEKDEAAERQRIVDQTNSAQLSANDARRQSELAMIDDEGERIQKEYSNKLAALKEAQGEERHRGGALRGVGTQVPVQ
jgi:chromosome segregation ATPase